MSLLMVSASSEVANKILNKPDLLNDIWFEGEFGELGLTADDVGGVDYRILAEGLEAMLEDIGEGPGTPEFGPCQNLEYDKGYGPAAWIEPANLKKAVKNDTWSSVKYMDKAVGQMLKNAVKAGRGLFFMIS